MIQSRNIGNIIPGGEAQFTDPFAKLTQYAQQQGQQIRADEKYAAEKARQDILDARVATLFEQQQTDRANALKEAEDLKLAKSLVNQIQPYLDAQPENVTVPVTKILGNANVNVPIGTSSVSVLAPKTYRTEPVYQTTEIKVDPDIMFEGGIVPTTDRKFVEPVDTRATIPTFSLAPLTIQDKKEISTTKLSNLNLDKPLDESGKPYTSSSTGNVYFTDTVSGKRVSDKDLATSIAGVDMTPKKVQTQVGTKVVEVPGLTKTISSAIKQGVDPKEAQATGESIRAGYEAVLNTLPKDNTKQRQQFTQWATDIYLNLGLDPDKHGLDKTVDRLLPKTEVSEAQKMAINATLQGLDKQLTQINEDKKLNLKAAEIASTNAYHNAVLDLDRIKTENQADYQNKMVNAALLKADSKAGDPLQKELQEALGRKRGEELSFIGQIKQEKELEELLKQKYDASDKGGFFGFFGTPYGEFASKERPKLYEALAARQEDELKKVKLK